MQLAKIISILVTLVAVIIGIYLYFTRETGCDCGDKPWWIIILLIIANIVLMIYTWFARKKD